jgi:hypothetical protein
MPYRPKRAKQSEPKPGALDSGRVRARQIADQRQRDTATRSTLSRLRNRKSDLK